LIGGHYTHLDLAGLMVNMVADMDVIYRKNNDPVFEHAITGGKKRVFKNVLERSDMRSIVKKLRQGWVVWYSPALI
jgi:KDO2-lipid IV(A) lauroyltransferase